MSTDEEKSGPVQIHEVIDLKWKAAERAEKKEAIDEARGLFEEIKTNVAIRTDCDASSGKLHPRIRLADMIIGGMLSKQEFNELEEEVLGVEFGSAGFDHDELPF